MNKSTRESPVAGYTTNQEELDRHETPLSSRNPRNKTTNHTFLLQRVDDGDKRCPGVANPFSKGWREV